MLLTIVSLLIALSIMVLVHEFGHLVAAKRAGIVVEEFGMGYPPRLVTLGRNRGKVVIEGQPIAIPRGFAWPQGIGVGTRVKYEAAAEGKGRKVLTRIEPASVDESEAEAGSRIEYVDRGTLYSINAIPFGGFAKMLGEEDPTFPGSFASKGKLTRIGVLVAGSAMNFLTAILFFAFAYGLGAPAAAEPENAVVNAVSTGSPAESAGLLPGDIVLKADGTDILTILGLQEYTKAHLSQPIVLTVQRGNETVKVTVIPRAEPPEGQGPMGVTLGPRTIVKRYPWYAAMGQGFRQAFALAGFTLTVPVQVIRGLIPADLARPVGPVGIGQLVGDAVRYSLDSGWWYPVMQMLGSLSVALAVTNLLPLPGLDGGRILFIVVEAIRRRRLDPAKEGLVHLVGMALLVALMLLITWQDVVNPIPALDWSRLF
jgi:regulator of sigma E protease